MWAPGDEGWALPDDVGFPMFDSTNNQAVRIEIHYDNPSLVNGMKDSSGVRFYYSNTPRTYNAGILEVGDPWLGLYEEKINDGMSKYSFTCPGVCSSSILAKERDGDQGVTVISECKSSESCALYNCIVQECFTDYVEYSSSHASNWNSHDK